mmetsp:Transcript_23507/g.34276  ORF Transcript_23507/g.34276 Transcript_23507/m.34276 type:complete len:160 (+) Transcript_23507:371-850(+)
MSSMSAPKKRSTAQEEKQGHACLTNTEGVDEETETWDQNVDYSELVFAHTDLSGPQEAPPGLPDMNNLSTSVTKPYAHALKQLNGQVNELWTLLDSQSTVDLFCNGKMLKHIKMVNTWLQIYSTGGTTHTNQVGFLEGYCWVWYHPKGIANILLLSCVI